MKQDKEMLLRWKKVEDGACLLQVLGDTSVIALPDEVEGIPITEIGAYCFSVREQKILKEKAVFESLYGTKEKEALCPLEGNELEEVVLPMGIRRIGNAAFYNCRKLRRITVGRMVQNIGSDVFVNCNKLKQIFFKARIKEENGASLFLSRIASEIELFFLTEDESVEAALLYTEYYEVLDEIAPAHIFGRNIVGEGFRARQYFKNGIVQLEEYDSIFEKVSHEEEITSLGKMALNRLRYPIDLTEQNHQRYSGFLMEQNEKIATGLVCDKRKEDLEFLCSNRWMKENVLEQCILQAVQMEWSEGAASLLEWKKKYYKPKRKNRYEF